MRRRGFHRPHLVERDRDSSLRDLPGGLAAGEPGTDDVDWMVQLLGYGGCGQNIFDPFLQFLTPVGMKSKKTRRGSGGEQGIEAAARS